MALTDDDTSVATTDRQNRKGWLAAGGVLGAVLASACCIGPLVLLTLGISGAWIANLTALEPYKELFAVIALGFVIEKFNIFLLTVERTLPPGTIALAATRPTRSRATSPACRCFRNSAARRAPLAASKPTSIR